MRFGILGTTRAWRTDGREVIVGGPALRTLLVLLLAREGEAASADSLVEELYGDRPPSDAGHALQSQISRLRRTLAEATIDALPSGYRLPIGDHQIDVTEFERLSREGRQALGDGEPRRAAELLRAALALWRRAALADVADAPSARAVAHRLEERRLTCVEDRVEAELRLGEHRAAVAELRELVARQPLRERSHGLLMRALAASDETAAALSTFAAFRRRLVEELGAEPSADLTAVHLALLRPQARTGVPMTLTSFVGRSDDVAAVAKLLTGARLVTIYGPGGVGKTRLAAEVAARRADVLFVRLAALRHPPELPSAILTGLGLRDSGPHPMPAEASPTTRLLAALSTRSTLLILDNCEHLVDAVAELVEQVLTHCPGVRVLATSRETLRASGEHLWPVSVLDEAAAARLFADRAAAAQPRFAPDATTAEAVTEICRRLDGLPLAIELAAARLRTMDVAALRQALADRFAVLSRGNRTAEPRHQTLRAAVAWSWDLLPEQEQAILRRLSVFAGDADVTGATHVCALPDVPDALDSLVDKSLLCVAAGRYRMLETVAAYADERLAEAGESDATRRAHAGYLLTLAQTADPHLRTGEQLTWLRTLGDEHANLLAALRWAAGAGETDLSLRLVAASATYFWMRGARGLAAEHAAAVLDRLADGPPAGLENEYVLCVLAAAHPPGHPGRRHIAAATQVATAPGRPSHPVTTFFLSTLGADGDAGALLSLMRRACGSADAWEVASAHLVLGYPQFLLRDAAAAQREFEQALEGFRSLGERWGQAMALGSLAGLASFQGGHARAVALTDAALRLLDELGATEERCDLSCDRGDYRVRDAVATGTDPSIARADYEEAALLAGRAGLPVYEAMASRGLADIAYLLGDVAEARRRYERALPDVDTIWIRGAGIRVDALTGLGLVALAEHDPAQARAHCRQAIEIAAATGVLHLNARAVDVLAAVELRDGDPARAASLLGAARALRGPAGAVEPATVRHAETARLALGPARYEALYAASARLGSLDALRLLGVPEQVIAGSPAQRLAGELTVSAR
ncbi:AAA family ATPase [Dactylosporangium sp. NBC_01737]|uniref:ATP-binding protein n=1 Tax=Dactylosporangium sp. NBC_01737 TaxID=2975959 RepID=UPI002E0F28A7|nr:AAA family ATPase [Dactylosporangium sp. NBC_01737]